MSYKHISLPTKFEMPMSGLYYLHANDTAVNENSCKVKIHCNGIELYVCVTTKSLLNMCKKNSSRGIHEGTITSLS